MKFEYKTMKVVESPLEDEALNAIGAERWRLVSLVLYSAQERVGEGPVRTFTYVFIREKK